MKFNSRLAVFSFLSACFCMLSTSPVAAQSSRTGFFMETSKFRHQVNPALLEDNPYVSIPLLGNVYGSASGSHAGDALIYKVTDGTTGKKVYDTFMNKEVAPSVLYQRLGGKDVSVDAEFNTSLFSIGFLGFGGTNLVEINLRNSAHLALPNQLFHYAKEPAGITALDMDYLGLQQRSFAEIAVGHARNIGNHFTVGAKVKGLLGLSYIDIEGKHLKLQAVGNRWNVSGETRGVFSLMRTSPTFDDKGRFNGFDDLSAGLSGWGLGTDLGVTYDVHGVEGLVVSASLTDLGFINISQARALENRVNHSWSFDGFRDNSQADFGDNVDQFKEDLQNLLSLRDGGKTTTTTSLRSNLNLGVQYELPYVKYLRVGALYTKHFDEHNSFDELTIGAGWHPVEAIELGVSTTHLKNSWRFGTMLTLQAPRFQFFVGTDYWSGSFSTDGMLSARAHNVNFGFTIPLD